MYVYIFICDEAHTIYIISYAENNIKVLFINNDIVYNIFHNLKELLLIRILVLTYNILGPTNAIHTTTIYNIIVINIIYYH
jgi:hypothetical protein